MATTDNNNFTNGVSHFQALDEDEEDTPGSTPCIQLNPSSTLKMVDDRDAKNRSRKAALLNRSTTVNKNLNDSSQCLVENN